MSSYVFDSQIVLLWFHILFCETRLEIMSIKRHPQKVFKYLNLEKWTALFITRKDLISCLLAKFFCPSGVSIKYREVILLQLWESKCIIFVKVQKPPFYELYKFLTCFTHCYRTDMTKFYQSVCLDSRNKFLPNCVLTKTW